MHFLVDAYAQVLHIVLWFFVVFFFLKKATVEKIYPYLLSDIIPCFNLAFV